MRSFARCILAPAVLALLLVFGVNEAWAGDPTVRLQHVSRSQIFNGSTNYDYGSQGFSWADITILNANAEDGEIKLNVSGSVNVTGYDANDKETYNGTLEQGETTFNAIYDANDGQHYIRALDDDDESVYYEFTGGADEAFSDQGFSLKFGEDVINGKFSEIKANDSQRNNCAPYLELCADENWEKLETIKWRFVNPSEPLNTGEYETLTKGDDAPVKSVSRIQIRTTDPLIRHTFDDLDEFVDGNELIGEIDVQGQNINVNDITQVRIYFSLDEDANSENSEILYCWRYDVTHMNRTVELQHITYSYIVDGKTVYSPANEPNSVFNSIFMEAFYGPIGTTGTIKLDFSKGAYVSHEDEEGEIHEENPVSQQYEAKLWEYSGDPGWYYVGDDKGLYIGLYYNGLYVGNNQTALSNTDFSLSFGDTGETNGTFPTIVTTEKQLQDCAPYMELVTDSSGKVLRSIKWRFVKPSAPGTALTNDDTASHPTYLYRIRIQLKDGSRIQKQLDTSFAAGDKMEGTLAISENIKVDDISYVRPYFYYKDGKNSTIRYSWRFHVKNTQSGSGQDEDTDDDETPTDESGSYESDSGVGFSKLSEEELASAKANASSVIGDIPVLSEAADASIKTGTTVDFDKADEIVYQHTSSAISISQELGEGNEGGALVLGKDLALPLLSKSIDGLIDLPPVTDLADLKKKYSVLKSFEKGGAVDLLSIYGDTGLFSYDAEDKTVKLNATIIIVDAAATDKADGEIKRPLFGGGKYGVRLSDDEKYLYIFDGVKDGVASDPIILAQKTEDNDTRGNSGCSTSSFALALLAALVAFSPSVRKKGGAA